MVENVETIKTLLGALFFITSINGILNIFVIVILALFYNRFKNKDFIEGKINEADGSNKD